MFWYNTKAQRQINGVTLIKPKDKLEVAFGYESIELNLWDSHSSNQIILPKKVVRLSKLST